MTYHPPRVLQVLAEVHRHGPFESRVKLAVTATNVLFGTVIFPVGRAVKLGEGLVMAIRNQVAGTLPALRITGDSGPGAAQQITLSHQVVEVNWCIDDFVIFGELAHPS